MMEIFEFFIQNKILIINDKVVEHNKEQLQNFDNLRFVENDIWENLRCPIQLTIVIKDYLRL